MREIVLRIKDVDRFDKRGYDEVSSIAAENADEMVDGVLISVDSGIAYAYKNVGTVEKATA